MKKYNTFIPMVIGTTLMLVCSCKSLSEFESLDAKYRQQTREYNVAKQELNAIKDENAELLRQNQSLNANMTDMANARLRAEAAVDDLTRRLEKLQNQYDTTMENYVQQLSGKTRDLTKANNLLTARTKELADKEAAFKARESEFAEQQASLRQRQDELEKAEASARNALAAKERELESVRNAVTKALVGFTDKGLNVETKDGKVYVSMDSKLMFPSASWTVSKEGAKAIEELAKVLEENTELNIMVEGHTDNDAYKGNGAVKDNWDLSVMRATSIVKLLLKYGPNIDPSRIEASGHGEFSPKVENTSTANKAINRRTEIILTPKLSDILNMLN